MKKTLLALGTMLLVNMSAIAQANENIILEKVSEEETITLKAQPTLTIVNQSTTVAYVEMIGGDTMKTER